MVVHISILLADGCDGKRIFGSKLLFMCNMHHDKKGTRERHFIFHVTGKEQAGRRWLTAFVSSFVSLFFFFSLSF